MTQHVPIRHTGHVSDLPGWSVLPRPPVRTPEPGDILVASPSITDPSWRRALILLLDQDDSGAVGVMINRKAELDGDILPLWVSEANEIMIGGPVSPEGLIGICPSNSELAASALTPDFGLMDLDQVESTIESLGALQVSYPWRLYVGYAGWGEGQLATEIERGDWFVVAGQQADVLMVEPDQAWSSVLHRQKPNVQAWATLPDKPEMN